MSEAPRQTLTWDSYLAWESRQPTRHELVNGCVYAMTGGTADHDTIGNNLRGELRMRLRGKPCRSHGPDLKVRAGGNGRYPDALIDCGPRVPDAMHAQEPTVIFEALPTNAAFFDQHLKLRDYEAVPFIQRYVIISQNEPRVLIYRRDSGGRFGAQGALLPQGLEASIDLGLFDITLPLSLIYEGVTPLACPIP